VVKRVEWPSQQNSAGNLSHLFVLIVAWTSLSVL
jgi:hypothetical protein